MNPREHTARIEQNPTLAGDKAGSGQEFAASLGGFDPQAA